METSGAASLIAALSAFIAGMSGAIACASAVRSRIAADQTQSRSGAESGLRRLIVRGIASEGAIVRSVLGNRRIASWCDGICAALNAAGVESSRRSVCSLALVIAAIVLVASIVQGSVVLGVLIIGALVAAASARAARVVEARQDRIRDDLPDALRTMGVCFHAGFTLQQTFDQLQREFSGPLGALFRRAAEDIRTGSTLDEALESIRHTGSTPELSFVSVALAVHHQTGGSMQHVLNATCDSLATELELRRSLRVHTAQARLSARVVVGVTVGLVGVLLAASPGFLDPFFSSIVGFALLGLALVMQVAGIIAVRRLLHVEVD